MRAYRTLHEQVPLIRVEAEVLLIDTGATNSLSRPEGADFLKTRRHVGGAGGVPAGGPGQGLMGMMAGLPGVGAMLAGLFDLVVRAVRAIAPGIDPDALVGVDHLAGRTVLIDTRNRLIALGGPSSTPTPGGHQLHTQRMFGLPVVHVRLEGAQSTRRVALDSGAHLGYLLQIPGNFDPAGRRQDAHPLVGPFEVEVARGLMSLQSANGEADVPLGPVEVGTLPPMLAMNIRMAGLDGVLGNAVFDRAPVRFYSGLERIELLPPAPHEGLGPVYDQVYDAAFGRVYHAATEALIHRVLGLVGSNGTVLDIGAGTGRIAIPLAQRGCRVTVVEPSRSMMGRLLERAEEESVTVEAHLGIAPGVELQAEQADLALLAFGVCEYLSTDEEAVATLEAAWRAVRPGGLLLLQPTPMQFIADHEFNGHRWRRSVRVHEEGPYAMVHHVIVDTTTNETVVDELLRFRPRDEATLTALCDQAGWALRRVGFDGAFPTWELERR
jgi:ubiquinone/menaquinone biosynthesis C-methylase UbiE